MNSIRPGILLVSVAAVALSAVLLWTTRPTTQVAESQSAEGPAAAEVVPLVPVEEEPAIETRPAEEPAAAEIKPKIRRHPLGKKYAAKERQKKIDERREALDKLNALRYSDSEAQRIRDAWEQAMGEAEDEIKELRATQPNIGGREKRLAYMGAYEQLRVEFGDEDYSSARYAADLSTWVGISDLTPNSPAEALGLLEGDQLYSYNGQRIFAIQEVGALWAAEVVGGIATLGFVRGGQLFFLDVDRGYLGVPMVGRSLAPN